MTNHQSAISNHQSPRSGFTLVELLMVISIIALLLALIVPAAQGVIRNVKNKQVASEITGLENAVSDFNAKYKVRPPSTITLYERGADWNTPAARPSRAMIRRIFGIEFDFAIDRDINNNGVADEAITLNGSQCLVFFLGGLPDTSGGTLKLIGFSHSKTNPFSRNGTNRLTFYSDFDITRMQLGANGMPSYHDRLNEPADGGAPLLYYSKMRTGRYEATDNTPPGFYYQGTAATAAQTAWKDIQIISPGRDNTHGGGGRWLEDDSTGVSAAGQDDITNFSGGVLGR